MDEAIARPRLRMGDPATIGVIAVGGMLGATARYSIARALPTQPGTFPWATFWTNSTGSLVLGFLLVLIVDRLPTSRYLRPFLATGVLGAYTTMSTFLVEVCLLVDDGHPVTAIVYAAATVAAGVGLAAFGVAAARGTSRSAVLSGER
jgi:CrcB protein